MECSGCIVLIWEPGRGSVDVSRASMRSMAASTHGISAAMAVLLKPLKYPRMDSLIVSVCGATAGVVGNTWQAAMTMLGSVYHDVMMACSNCWALRGCYT